MALLTVNGVAVFSATITMPRVGAWHADIAADETAAITGAVTLSTTGASWKGTVVRGDKWRGLVRLRVVAGAAGLGFEVPAKYYRRTPLSLILRDTLSYCAETLAGSSDATAMNSWVERWSRRLGRGGEALQLLCDHVGCTWRSLDDGSIQVGPYAYTPTALDYRLLGRWPDEGRIIVASETPSMRPGMLVDGMSVSSVVHRFEGASVRTEAWYE